MYLQIWNDYQLIYRFSSSVGLSTMYDYHPSARDDPLVRMLEDTVTVGIEMTTPENATLLQLFPFRELTLIDEKDLTSHTLMQYSSYLTGAGDLRSNMLPKPRPILWIKLETCRFNLRSSTRWASFFESNFGARRWLHACKSFLGQSSMVADGLQKLEMQNEASKPMFEIALKNAVVAAVMGMFL